MTPSKTTTPPMALDNFQKSCHHFPNKTKKKFGSGVIMFIPPSPFSFPSPSQSARCSGLPNCIPSVINQINCSTTCKNCAT